MKIFKEAKIFFGSMIVLSWLTVPFLGAKYIKKYKYAVGFISVFIFIESFVAKKFNGGRFQGLLYAILREKWRWFWGLSFQDLCGL
ncbi:hypothetical protein ACR3I8_01225 [Priestia flexa]